VRGGISRFAQTLALDPAISWFETREDALLTMRSENLSWLRPHPEERALARVSKDAATEKMLTHPHPPRQHHTAMMNQIIQPLRGRDQCLRFGGALFLAGGSRQLRAQQ
jgi:hypothetical protein